MSLPVMLLVAGCFLAPEDQGIGTNPPVVIPPPDHEERALYMLQADMLRAANWPEDYDDCQIFVCNPSMYAEDLAIIRQDIPGAICLAYTSAQDVPLDLYGSPYYDALAAMFPEEWCIHDLNTGEIVRIYGHGTPYATPSFIMQQPTADALVEFHRTVTMAVNWDGFYIDQCNKVFPNHRKITLQEITDRFDIDNNNIRDSIALLDARYGQWRPYFTTKMRATFPTKRIIANSGGQLDDPALNGITLEGVGDRFTVTEARNFLLSQKAVSFTPFTAVLWKSTEESEEGTRYLSDEMPGVYYGAAAPVADPPGQLRSPTLRHMAPPPSRTLEPTRVRDENGAPR